MRIGIIGAGNVGRALGLRWAEAGHEVTFGVRDPSSDKYEALRGGSAVESLAETTARSEILVLATPWGATEEALAACGDLSGKILVDCTNPLEADLSGLTHGLDDSGGEQVARWAKGARVIKAFNSVGSNIMEDTALEGRRPVMFIAGDEAGRIPVRQLSEELGFETVDVGGLTGARLLEPLAMLWIQLAYQHGLGRDWALSMVRRETS